ncbi:MAG TPA: rhomboid family intramembrane serine protease [Ruminiclostridium sp.]
MKTNFINSLIRYLVEKEYFNIIRAEHESLDFSKSPTSLIKDYQGTSVLLEVIDADRYSCEQLTHMMASGAAMLGNINGNNASIFRVFLFDDKPDEEKINIIEQGQVDIILEKRFMKCISVNIKSKNVQKHFRVPAFDANIIKSLKRFFSKDFDTRETSSEEVADIIVQRQKDNEIQIKAKKPWVTYGLIAINFAVWLILNLLSMKTGTSYNELLSTYGSKVNALILGGEYWRFISPMFLHSDIIHVSVNCYSLYIVGSQVERLYGHGKLTVIYFLSGFIGCIASFAFSINDSVGASGAIFGLLGAMLYFAVKRPSLLKSSFGANLITILIINLTYGFMNKQIDNYAHFGGLVGGFLTTGVVYSVKEETAKDKLIKMTSLILVIAVIIGGLFYGFNNEQNRLASKIATLQTYDSQQNWSESEKLSEEILALNPSDKSIKTSVLWNLAKAEINQTKYEEGIVHANQLVELSPADGHYILGVIYYDTAQYGKAKEELQMAKKLESPNTEAIDKLLADMDSK